MLLQEVATNGVNQGNYSDSKKAEGADSHSRKFNPGCDKQ